MEDILKEVMNSGKSKKLEEKDKDYVRWLFELSNKDVNIGGGKGASLAEMHKKKFPVPPAFIITSSAFEKFIERISEGIKKIVEGTDVDKTDELNESSYNIRKLIEEQDFPDEMEKEVLEAYEILGTEKHDSKLSGDVLNILRVAKEPVFVAVRSSATTEDLEEASFAGQQETFLNVKGNQRLLSFIKKCFSSLYTPRAIYYRNKKGFKEASIAVVVQKMINSEKSGVMFTKNPLGNEDNILIEAVYGLGEGVVSGKIQPDNYIVNPELEILNKKTGEKKKAIVRNAAGETEEIQLTEERSKQQVLSDGQIKELANIGLRIESHYKKPQDIEFAIEDGNVYIVQSRPITTLGKESKKASGIEGKILLSGQPASPGVASGKVKIVKSVKDLENVKKGDILVTEMTNPDMVVTMQKSDAIITDEGGVTSHASIVSREMGIPCVVGTKNATELLQEGQSVTVDGGSGKVYEGEVGKEEKKEVLPIVKTKTEVKVIVDVPEYAKRAALTECDSVGLLRLEGVIAASGKHPMHFVKENRIEAYTELLEKGISRIAEPFDSVWVRASDIRSDEYKNLEGAPGEEEGNPMLGFHGIRFSLKNKKIMEAELQAIRKVAEKNPIKKIGIMFPQVITAEEAAEARKEFAKMRTENMEFGIMIETPASVHIIQELCDVGIDFVSLGTNDLTQYTLAVDRNNEQIQDIYDEMHPSILRQAAYVISICKKNGVKTSICGQAGSNPEMVKFLVKHGIDSITVNADAAHPVSELIKKTEEKLEEEEKGKTTGTVEPLTQEFDQLEVEGVPDIEPVEVDKKVNEINQEEPEKSEYIKSQMNQSSSIIKTPLPETLEIIPESFYTPQFKNIQDLIEDKVEEIKTGKRPEVEIPKTVIEKAQEVIEQEPQPQKQNLDKVEEEIKQLEQKVKQEEVEEKLEEKKLEELEKQGHEVLDIF